MGGSCNRSSDTQTEVNKEINLSTKSPTVGVFRNGTFNGKAHALKGYSNNSLSLSPKYGEEDDHWQRYQQLQIRVNELENEQNSITSKNEEYQTELEVIKPQLSEKVELNLNLENQNNILESQCQDLQSELNKVKMEKEQLQIEIEKSKQDAMIKQENMYKEKYDLQIQHDIDKKNSVSIKKEKDELQVMIEKEKINALANQQNMANETQDLLNLLDSDVKTQTLTQNQKLKKENEDLLSKLEKDRLNSLTQEQKFKKENEDLQIKIEKDKVAALINKKMQERMQKELETAKEVQQLLDAERKDRQETDKKNKLLLEKTNFEFDSKIQRLNKEKESLRVLMEEKSTTMNNQQAQKVKDLEQIINERQQSVDISKKEITELNNKLKQSTVNENDMLDMKAKYKQYKERAIRYRDQENEHKKEKKQQQMQINALLQENESYKQKL